MIRDFAREHVEKAELQCIESYTMLRVFYDRHGYDCVSATGSVPQLVDKFLQRRRDTANSRGWESTRNKIYGLFAASIIFAVVQAAVNFSLCDWDDATARTLGATAPLVLLFPIAIGICFVDLKRKHRRALYLAQIANESES